MTTKAAAEERPGGRARDRRQSVRDVVSLWADLFRRHDLGTFSVAIAYGTIVAAVALVLLGIGLLGLAGRHDVWTQQLAPHVQGRVLPAVFKGLDQTVDRVFAHSTGSLIALA